MKIKPISENFNITVNLDINDLLESDKVNFHINNRNLLINKIVYYYLKNEVSDGNPLKKKIKEKLSSLKINNEEEIEEVYNLIKEMIYFNNKPEKELFKLNFRLNKDTFKEYQEYILKIENKKFNQTKFFREIFSWYKEKKQFEREKILYNEEFKRIEEVIKDKRVLSVSIRTFKKNEENKEIKMAPLGIVTSKNENFSYLLGYSEKIDRVTREKTGVFDVYPTRISNITNPLKGKNYKIIKDDSEEVDDIYNVRESFIKKAENMIENKMVTAGKEKKIKIALTEYGKYQLETIVHNRPFKLYEIEKENYDKEKNRYIYEFRNTNFATLIYFFNFGKECEILSPEDLKKEFIKKHLDSLEVYK